jgi:NAD(P)-dependent dehydrogenase (short-subunit alcohol dehydrogenase family)
MDPKLFINRVFLVTGAATGIGLGVTKQLATYGAHVYALDVHEAQPAELKTLASPLVAYMQCDVRSRDTCHQTIAGIVEKHGRLDGVVNNAGICEIEGETPDDEIYDKIMETNVRGVWNIGTEAIVQMKTQGSGGSIINIGSTSALKGEQRLPVYTASKHAVAGLTRTWALDQAKYGIRVNCVAPGELSCLNRALFWKLT